MSEFPTLFFPDTSGNPNARGHGFHLSDHLDVARIENYVVKARKNQIEPIIRLQDTGNGVIRTLSFSPGIAFELSYQALSPGDQTQIDKDADTALELGLLYVNSWKSDSIVTYSGAGTTADVWKQWSSADPLAPPSWDNEDQS
ncbi:hypothetical protein [Timonella senegalensis]|uniref:hypothetical protein n=1 Tax=Timonella senegalensis TaxID=1465825 RepID=UPI00031C65EA|nr:hypothetical protein [Timonella senegalensis]